MAGGDWTDGLMNAFVALLPYLVGLSILLALSAFFSGSETALFSLTRAQAKRMSEGTRLERAVHELLQQPQRLLSSILVGNMLVNVMLASVIGSLSGRLLAGRGIGAAIGITTALLLIFGEVTPKTIAVRHAAVLSRVAALPLLWFSRAITPIRVVLRGTIHVLLTLIGQSKVPGWGVLTQAEIAGMLAVGQATGATDENERALVEQILALDDVDARDAMVPRTEVRGVSSDLTLAQAYQKACEWRHSRLPVYDEDLDDIWGIVVVVDLPRWQDTDLMNQPLSTLRPAQGSSPDPAPETSPVYPAYVVPETANIGQLLTTMQDLRAQLVVLVDEYGGTAGILTLDDILEEVIGRFSTREREDDVPFVPVEGGYLVDGHTHVRQLNRALDLELPQNGTDTVGGYAMELLGRLPRAGDVVDDGRYQFRVIKMAGRRIGALRLDVLPQTDVGGDQ